MLEGGELLDALSKQGSKAFSESLLAGYMKQILTCLEFLHGKGIIHRNINLHTLNFAEKDCKTIKLTDFTPGDCEKKEVDKAKEILDNPIFIAPEILNHQEADQYCDIWCLGIVLYILLSGSIPFSPDCADDYETLSNKVKSKSFEKEELVDGEWRAVSDDAKDFLLEMLQKEPKKRADATELLNHKWLKRAKSDPRDPTFVEKALKVLQVNRVRINSLSIYRISILSKKQLLHIYIIMEMLKMKQKD